MLRTCLCASTLMWLLSRSFAGAHAPDEIGQRLDQAKATFRQDMEALQKAATEHLGKREAALGNDAKEKAYQADMAKFRQAVKVYLDKREDFARQNGNKKLVDEIKADRKAFEDRGELPKTMPAALKRTQMDLDAAAKAGLERRMLLEQIKAQQDALAATGELPAKLPPDLEKMRSAARAKMEDAFNLAVKEYTAAKKDDEATAVAKELKDFGEMQKAPGAEPAAATAYPWRFGAAKAALLREGGGNDETELGVARALAWLAKQQNAAGYWEFDGKNKEDRAAATGMCLLAFLAAGETHLNGKNYKDTVKRGVNYLKAQVTADGHFGAAGAYAQAIATMAVCEAAGMSKDPAIKAAAAKAVDYVVKAQAANGSWGYTAGLDGDTSILGWQIQALKSARVAQIPVPEKSFEKAGAFLDSVSGDNGVTYGYRSKGATHPLTAVALLSREFMGWPKNNPLARGVDYLWIKNPPKDGAWDMYYYYYATQVVRFFDGRVWRRDWNPVMRDVLLKKQFTEKNGAKANAAEIGGWPKDTGHIGECCGKLGTSALACLTLQVYYRHQPLYQKAEPEQK
jgi:hypothetical protein